MRWEFVVDGEYYKTATQTHLAVSSSTGKNITSVQTLLMCVCSTIVDANTVYIKCSQKIAPAAERGIISC